MNDHPTEGGSYVRDKDGKLKRAESEAPAESVASEKPLAPAEPATTTHKRSK